MASAPASSGAVAGVPEPPRASAAPAPPSGEDVRALLAEYAAGVKAAVLRRHAVPALAQSLGHEGSVKLRISIGIDGALENASVTASSGFTELDEAALNCVQSAAPFGALPQATGRTSLSIAMTLKYSLE